MSLVCRVCSGSVDLAPIHVVWREDGYRFWKCLSCGSETSDRNYTLQDYRDLDRQNHFANQLGGWENALEELNTNVWLFEKHMSTLAGLQFLDVGYCDGAMLCRMQKKGADSYGFDVVDNQAKEIAERANVPYERLRHGDSLTETFGDVPCFELIQCREVIEHVQDPISLMREMERLLWPGGLLQIQTPCPSGIDSRIPYQIQHLCLLSEVALRIIGKTLDLEIVEYMNWNLGHCIVFRKSL